MIERIKKSPGLFHLVGKVIQELKDPSQLLDSDRRRDLVRKFRENFAGIMESPPQDLSTIEAQIRASLIRKNYFGGIEVGISSEIPLAYAIFPANADVRYFHPERDDRLEPQVGVAVAGPTRRIVEDELWPGDYADHGYKDSEGQAVRFLPHMGDERVQHGGIWIDNNTGELEILNYTDMAKKVSRPLTGSQVLMQAEWYMDSKVADKVSARSNMAIPQPYTGLGCLEFTSGERSLFALTNEGETRAQISRLANFRTNDNWGLAYMKQLAAFANVLAEGHGANSWSMVGMEYYGGGMNFPRETRVQQMYDYFEINRNRLS